MTNIDREALLNALHDRIDGDYLIDGDGEPVALTSSGAADVVRWAADAVIELVEDACEQDMTNIDQALVDQMAQTITDALEGCDLRTAGAAVYGGNVAAGAVTPLIAAAVDAARADGRREAGRAFVQWSMKNEIDEPPLDWAWFGEIVQWTGAALGEATP